VRKWAVVDAVDDLIAIAVGIGAAVVRLDS